MNNHELTHHGILGMKWGKRNGPPYPLDPEDHSASEKKAGWRKSLEKKSDKSIHRTLKKKIRDQRQKVHAPANKRWAVNTPIGENSKKVINAHRKNNDIYMQSKEYKDWEAKFDKLDKRLESDQIDIDQYDREWEKIYKEKPTENWNTLSFAKIYEGRGARYANNYLEKGGKDLSIAYLQDLGFDIDEATKYVERLIKSGRTLGDV